MRLRNSSNVQLPLQASPHHDDAAPKSAAAAAAYRLSSDKEGREPHRAPALRSGVPSLREVGRWTMQSSTDMAAKMDYAVVDGHGGAANGEGRKKVGEFWFG
jgi:hypothetical protein